MRYQQRMGRRISRLLGKPSKRAARTVKAVFHSFEPKTSMRPYLRQQMLTRLSERLIEMAAEKLKW